MESWRACPSHCSALGWDSIDLFFLPCGPFYIDTDVKSKRHLKNTDFVHDEGPRLSHCGNTQWTLPPRTHKEKTLINMLNSDALRTQCISCQASSQVGDTAQHGWLHQRQSWGLAVWGQSILDISPNLQKGRGQHSLVWRCGFSPSPSGAIRTRTTAFLKKKTS